MENTKLNLTGPLRSLAKISNPQNSESLKKEKLGRIEDAFRNENMSQNLNQVAQKYDISSRNLKDLVDILRRLNGGASKNSKNPYKQDSAHQNISLFDNSQQQSPISQNKRYSNLKVASQVYQQSFGNKDEYMVIPQATDEAVNKHTSEEYMADFIIHDQDPEDEDCEVDDSMDIESDGPNNFGRIQKSQDPDVLGNQRLNIPPGALP